MFKNYILRGKTDDSYPPILWIICISCGLVGAYNSQIGSTYHMTTDAILFISGWLIIIGLLVVFMAFNDGSINQQQEKVGIYSAINHPLLFGKYVLLIGLLLQALHIAAAVFCLVILSFYHKWLISRKWNTLFSRASYFRFNLFKMSDNKREYYFSNAFLSSMPYLLFVILYVLILIELRNRSIGRSLLDLF